MNNYKTRLTRDVLEMSAASAVGWQRVTNLLTDIETIASASDNIEINDTSIPTTNAVQTIVDNTMVNNDYITLVSASDISTATITDDTVPTTSAVQKMVNDGLSTIGGYITSAEESMEGDLVINGNEWKKFNISEHIDIVSADNFTYDDVNDNTVPTTSAVKKLVDDTTANMAISVSGITLQGAGAYFYGLNETNSKLNEAVIWKDETSTYLSYIEGYTEYMGRPGIAYTDSKQKLNTVVHATDHSVVSYNDSWLIYRDNTWSIGDQLIFKFSGKTYIGTINSWYTVRSTEAAIITDAILIAEQSSDSDFVHIVGAETITGKKTFTAAIDIKKDNSSGSKEASQVRVIWPQATSTERRFNLGYENNGNRGLWDSAADCWTMQVKGDVPSAVNMSFGKGIDLSASYTNKIVYGTYNKDMGAEAVVEFGAGTSTSRRTPLWLDNKNQARYTTPIGLAGKSCILTSPINISDYNNDLNNSNYTYEYNSVSFNNDGIAYYKGSPYLPAYVGVVSWNAIIGTLYITVNTFTITQDYVCEIELYAKESSEYICIAKRFPVVHLTKGQDSTLHIPYQYFNYTNNTISIYFKLKIHDASSKDNVNLKIANNYFQIDSGIVG